MITVSLWGCLFVFDDLLDNLRINAIHLPDLLRKLLVKLTIPGGSGLFLHPFGAGVDEVYFFVQVGRKYERGWPRPT